MHTTEPEPELIARAAAHAATFVAPEPIDQAGAADEAHDLATELAAHLARLTRLLEQGPIDFETRFDIGSDVLELTDALRDYAVGAFLIGGAA